MRIVKSMRHQNTFLRETKHERMLLLIRFFLNSFSIGLIVWPPTMFVTAYNLLYNILSTALKGSKIVEYLNSV